MSGELERLKEKIRKDPNSRLFISLADLYRKEGMIGEAVQVLTDGLERQPDYMSARVALGKIYLEENKPEKALSEFSLVAKAIPDNLFAQKKLAEIYMMMDEREKARTAFEMVVRLNPLDIEAEETLKRLKGGLPSEEISGPGHTIAENEGDLISPLQDMGTDETEIIHSQDFLKTQDLQEETEAGPETVFSIPLPEDFDLSETETGQDLKEESGLTGPVYPVFSETPDETEGEEGPDALRLEDISNWFNTDKETEDSHNSADLTDIHEEAIKGQDAELEIDRETEHGGPFEELLENEISEIETGEPDVTGETHEVSDDIVIREELSEEDHGLEKLAGEAHILESPHFCGPEKDRLVADHDSASRQVNDYIERASAEHRDLKRADDLIHSGQYARGLMVLKKRLELYPNDLQTLQKFEELKLLIKLLGLENETRASMLEIFLDSARERKNGPSEEKTL
ncbi:MAG: hypothetical protein M0Z61_06230 [Nitrospiraceae bacterium]|nr:hypothetical protein [Nitrospiraceae bacterium]